MLARNSFAASNRIVDTGRRYFQLPGKIAERMPQLGNRPVAIKPSGIGGLLDAAFHENLISAEHFYYSNDLLSGIMMARCEFTPAQSSWVSLQVPAITKKR